METSSEQHEKPMPALSYPFPVKFLRSRTVENILNLRERGEKRELFDVDEHETIEVALLRMSKHHLKAMPVRAHGEKKVWKAMITVRGLLAFLMLNSKEQISDVKEPNDNKKVQGVIAKMNELMQLKLDYFLDYAFSPLYSFKSTTPLATIVDLFRTGVHYALIEQDSRDYVTIVSQGDVARYLLPFVQSEIKGVADLSVQGMMLHAMKIRAEQDLNQLAKPVEGRKLKYAVTMPLNLQAWRILYSMTLHRILAVALIDVKNPDKIVTNLSISDFHPMNRHNLAALFTPIIDYLGERGQRPPITIHRDGTVGTVLTKCVENDMHGLWVVDEADKVMGRVSLTDVFDSMIPQPEVPEAGKAVQAPGAVAREE